MKQDTYGYNSFFDNFIKYYLHPSTPLIIIEYSEYVSSHKITN